MPEKIEEVIECNREEKEKKNKINSFFKAVLFQTDNSEDSMQ